MAKAKRLLQQQLSKADIAVELCDARIPLSSRNPDLDRMLTGKRRILLLCKADLADGGATADWLRFFEQKGIMAMAYDTSPQKTRKARELMDKAAKEFYERAERRGIQKTLRAMVVGVPNVGKSTFINRLTGSATTDVGDRPGVTRANRWVKVNPYLEVLDTPGMLWPKLSDKKAAMRLAYIGTIRDAVYDQLELSIHLLSELLEDRKDVTCERFKIKIRRRLAQNCWMRSAAAGGFLLKGGVSHYDRAGAVILDEFRAGKLGRITLEQPPVVRGETRA